MALFEEAARRLPEPLYLPRGSIRALVAIFLAVSSWVMVFRGDDVPSYVLGLLLAVIGYYFGFRSKVQASEGHIYDPAAEKTDPLALPAGCIRTFLIVGFLVAGIVLHLKGRLTELRYLEFFAILFGVVVGFMFSKALDRVRGSSFYMGVAHGKGFLAPAAAGWLSYLLISGRHGDVSPHVPVAFSAYIGFYYGSRS